MNVHYHGEMAIEDPYAGKIEQFIRLDHPQLVLLSEEDKLDTLTTAFVATKQHRLGPLPTPEALVKIRSAIRYAISRDIPISVLIPWAGVKARGTNISSSLDLGEYSAFKAIACLAERVKRYHPRGISVIIRLEDLTEAEISSHIPNIAAIAEEYTRKMRQLRSVLRLDYITIVAESDLATHESFHELVTRYTPLFNTRLTAKDDATYFTAAQELQKAGWEGGVTDRLHDYLLAVQATAFPSRSAEEWNIGVATYLSTILARRVLNATGRTSAPMVELSFAKPLPGTPTDLPRVYYRTIPLAQTKNHLPPWNTRAIIRIADMDEIRLSPEPHEWDLIHLGTISVANEEYEVELEAPYTLED